MKLMTDELLKAFIDQGDTSMKIAEDIKVIADKLEEDEKE